MIIVIKLFTEMHILNYFKNIHQNKKQKIFGKK